MKISRLIKILKVAARRKIPDDFTVKGISCNSQNISSNYIFVAIKGARQDGNKFIPEAIKKGARVVISQRPAPKAGGFKNISFLQVKDARLALAGLAAEFYQHPSGKMKVVGITGTNGKTTVSYLIEAILKEAGFLPAVIGTINYRFKGRVIPAKNTTPGPLELQALFARMLKEGVDYVAMEVSSHSLEQSRTETVRFHSAIFTNLTQDHLDYHQSKENYFQAKARLFKQLKPQATAVINQDDPYGLRLKKITPAKIITYGIAKDADVRSAQIKFNPYVTYFQLIAGKTRLNLRTHLIGRHNLYNILAASAWAIAEGIKLEKIKSAVEKFSPVPGRLEKIDSQEGFSVFVDYAHTEDALKNVLESLRALAKKKMIVVFGCGGERDKTKRPKMGRVVSKLADYAIITNDNPRSENPLRIICDIRRGIKKDNYCVIPDRQEAIRKSLSLAQAEDIVLVAGKGHENYQILKDRIIPFDDAGVIKECLKSMNY